ncbi:MAG: DUF2760 domain-containing protein [Myxococcales bacterium]|nr:DUF2760 domain-containing protein [Myxococcales bacterium]
MPLATQLPFVTRFWLAWACLFRVLFDPGFASRVWAVREGAALPPGSAAPSLPAGGPPPAAPVVTSATPPAAPATTSALQLLSLLQREGRFVDFLQQDIAGFPDADVGVAARVVHEGCQRALRTHAAIEPVLRENEGSRVKLEAGFDADEVKLVGDVRGQPPYTGVLRHRGWRASRLELPQIVGAHDARVLAPAEVELA